MAIEAEIVDEVIAIAPPSVRQDEADETDSVPDEHVDDTECEQRGLGLARVAPEAEEAEEEDEEETLELRDMLVTV